MQKLVKSPGFKRSQKLIDATAKLLNVSAEEAEKALDDGIEDVWINEKYQVSCHRYEHPQFGPCMQINIRRRDGKVIFRDWRDFQDIKNQLAGEECEGLEIYPAESRKVDSANKYHIWVLLNPELRIPFGWAERDVQDVKSDLPGLRQRPLPKADTEYYKE